MEQCEVCGNHYKNILEIHKNGKTHYFDSFECAISKLASVCKHCQCKIVGHAVEANGEYFCCAHCASHQGN